ncbi:MAG: ATP-binding cassette domain-containing protein, partial [Polaromonas sp.]|nr:ATP-binding cassette domain-containing protein [Polaromonas sp.]
MTSLSAAQPEETDAAPLHPGNAAVSPVREQVLRVEKLTVSFDGFKAVDALSLSVERNELRVIIGPNGAGKTTLLTIVNG